MKRDFFHGKCSAKSILFNINAFSEIQTGSNDTSDGCGRFLLVTEQGLGKAGFPSFLAKSIEYDVDSKNSMFCFLGVFNPYVSYLGKMLSDASWNFLRSRANIRSENSSLAVAILGRCDNNFSSGILLFLINSYNTLISMETVCGMRAQVKWGSNLGSCGSTSELVSPINPPWRDNEADISSFRPSSSLPD